MFFTNLHYIFDFLVPFALLFCKEAGVEDLDLEDDEVLRVEPKLCLLDLAL
jgi:hypothetical protein